MNIKKRLNDIYMKHTGQPLRTIEDALERDTFLTAEMAKDFGIVDKVINRRPLEDITVISAKLRGTGVGAMETLVVAERLSSINS